MGRDREARDPPSGIAAAVGGVSQLGPQGCPRLTLGRERVVVVPWACCLAVDQRGLGRGSWSLWGQSGDFHFVRLCVGPWLLFSPSPGSTRRRDAIVGKLPTTMSCREDFICFPRAWPGMPRAWPGTSPSGRRVGVSSLVAWRFDGGFGRAGVIGAESAAGDLSPWLHLCAGKPPRPLRTKGREGACATHV